MKNAQNDHRINTPAPPQPGQQASGGGFPWVKVLAGCGCLTLVGLIVLGVAGYFIYQKGSKMADENGIKDLMEAAESAKENGQSADGEGADVQRQARKRKEEALDPKKIRAYVQEPLTQSDIDAHFAFVEEWQKNPAYKNWVEQYKKMQEIDKKDDDSVTGQLKAVGQSVKWVNAAEKVMKAFDKQVRDEGGYEQYYGRMIRIGGVVAASQTIAKTNKKLDDPNSDAVASQMLQERPEIAEQYKKNMKEAKKAIAEAEKAKKAGKKPDPSSMAAMGGLMTVFQGPGTIALARMPDKSFQTWKGLAPAKRKRLRESLNDAIAPGPWFGLFAVNPAGLLMSTYMAEMNELKAK